MSKWMKSLDQIVLERAAEQNRSFFENEKRRVCQFCGKPLSSKNQSNACREHWNQLPKKDKRKKP